MTARVRARGLTVMTLALLAVLLVVFVEPAAAAGESAAAHEPTAPAGAMQLQLVSVSPVQLAASSVLTLTVRVTNHTDEPVTGAVAKLSVNRRISLSRAMLENWATAKDSAEVGQEVAKVPVPSVAARSAVTVTVTATPADLGLTATSDWGPRGIAVVLTANGSRLDVLRTFAVWSPSASVTPVRVSILAAVTGAGITGNEQEDSSTLAAQTGADGRLGKVLAATADTPTVGWAVDPALLATAYGSKDDAVQSWASLLLATAKNRSVIALPAYDPDPAAYAHADRPWPTSTTINTGQAASSATATGTPSPTPTASNGSHALTIPSSWRSDVAWPAAGDLDLTTTALTTASGRRFVVVESGAMSPNDDLTYTPTALSTVPKQDGTVAIVADPILTDQIKNAAGTTAPDSSSTDSPAIRTQRLLAETAVIARERPNDQRDVLIALPRTWSPDPDAAKAQFAALAGAGWVRMTSIDEMLSTTPDHGHRASLPTTTSSSREISPGQLSTLANDAARLSRFATITENPSALTGPLQSAFVAPASIAFRSEPNARKQSISAAAEKVNATTSGVSAVTPSTVNLLSEKSDLPITVRNSLDQAVTVTVTLASSDTRLELMSSPTVTVPAHGQAEAKIPVHAIGTGNVRVTGTLSGPSGPISEPFTFKVRVRAKWETVGTVVMGTVLGLLFLGGIWRTIRRGGRSKHRVAGAVADQPAPPDAGQDRTPPGPAGRTEE